MKKQKQTAPAAISEKTEQEKLISDINWLHKQLQRDQDNTVKYLDSALKTIQDAIDSAGRAIKRQVNSAETYTWPISKVGDTLHKLAWVNANSYSDIQLAMCYAVEYERTIAEISVFKVEHPSIFDQFQIEQKEKADQEVLASQKEAALPENIAKRGLAEAIYLNQKDGDCWLPLLDLVAEYSTEIITEQLRKTPIKAFSIIPQIGLVVKF